MYQVTRDIVARVHLVILGSLAYLVTLVLVVYRDIQVIQVRASVVILVTAVVEYLGTVVSVVSRVTRVIAGCLDTVGSVALVAIQVFLASQDTVATVD